MTFWDSGTGWIKKKKNIFGGKGGGDWNVQRCHVDVCVRVPVGRVMILSYL